MTTPDEADFPRGGAYTPTDKGKKRRRKGDRDLFSSHAEEDAPKPKKKKTVPLKKKVAAKKQQDKKDNDRLKSKLGEPGTLSTNLCSPGMLLLGIVKHVSNYDLAISLPNGVLGKVPVTAISDGYTELLKRLANGDEIEDIKSLRQMVRPGMLVRCKVTEITQNKKGHKAINLTLNPREINDCFTSASLKNGMVLSGSVSSLEDHGYIIDLGIKGLYAFLKKAEAQKYIADHLDGEPLNVGSLVHCKVKCKDELEQMSGESRSIQVAINPREVFKSIINVNMGIKINTLVPGTRVEVTVKKTYANGLSVEFLSYSGSIHSSHIKGSPMEFEKGHKMLACVLYVHPVSKIVALTCLPHLLTPHLAQKDLFGDHSSGDILEDVPVFKVIANKGLLVKISSDLLGFASKKNLSDKEVQDIAKVFPKGSKVTCRIVDLNYCDKVLTVSLRKSILARTLLNIEDISPGDDFEADIKSVTKGGLSVQISNNQRGFIPTTHLTDIPLKHPENRFSPDAKIACRVLSVGLKKRLVVLTAKKTILASKYPKIMELTDVERNMDVEGVVNKITPKGVRVLFYNGVTGFMPKGYLGDDAEANPEKEFYMGQIVRCRVMRCIPSEDKLILTMKSTDENPKKSKKGKVDRSVETPKKAKKGSLPLVDLEVGQIVNVQVRARTAKGLVVNVVDSETVAFLPEDHLSDSLSNAKLLVETYEKGDIIEEVMVFKISNHTILSKKAQLVKDAKDEILVKEFSDLKPGIHIPGVVLNHKNYGIFVEFPNELIGLAPENSICDTHIANVGALHPVGQSVICKVTKVDEEKKRFLVSLRRRDCYPTVKGGTDGIDLVANYLEEMDRIKELYQNRAGVLLSHNMGEIVTVTVTEKTDLGALCSLPDGTKGVIIEDHITDVATCKKGNSLQGVVLYVDLENDCLELSLDKKLITRVKGYAKNKYSAARVRQKIKSDVVLIKDDFVLVALRGHALGCLAYLPAKLHLNDVWEKRQFEITQENAVVIKRNEDGRVIAGLGIHESESEEKTETSIGHSLRPGVIVNAKILKVLPFQINIEIGAGKTHGRVHIMEVKNKVKEGSSPIATFKEGATVKVKVIGYRENKTNKHIPVTHSRIFKSIPECTLVPSKIKSAGLAPHEDVFKSSYSTGDKVSICVERFANEILWVQVTPKFRGKIIKAHISSDKKVKDAPLDRYKVGKCYTATVTGPPKANVLPLTFIESRRESKDIEDGAVVHGEVLASSSQGLIVSLGSKHKGRVAPTDIADEYTLHPWKNYETNSSVSVYVISCKNPSRCVLSMRASRLKTKKVKIVDPELELVDIEEEKVVTGYVSKIRKREAYVTLGRTVAGRFDTAPGTNIREGDLVKCQITKIEEKNDNKHIIMSLLSKEGSNEKQDDSTVEQTPRKRKLSSENESPVSKAARVDSSDDSDEEEEIDEKQNGDDSEAVTSGGDALSKPRLAISSGFSWDADLTLLKPTDQLMLDSDSDDGDDEEEKKNKVSSRKTRQERLAAQREEERRLVEKEQNMMDDTRVPESAEEFDRLVLQSPDSSLIWLRYMAFHLETTEIEKARAVAERALKTISFREEQEKLNVWVAYMNLENMYGTSDTLKMVFERAVQHNEPIKVYTQLVNIYETSGKEEAAELLYNTMIRKFSPSKDVWINFGVFYFKHNKPKSAQKLMQRSLNSLEEKHHVEVLSKFAQMEFKYGEPERGKTMFENILNSYPKRTDLWSVYIDMMIKRGDLQQVRNLFERIITQNFAAKKMKFFFKKQLEFEQKYGNDETVATVKQKAIAYVEARESLV